MVNSPQSADDRVGCPDLEGMFAVLSGLLHVSQILPPVPFERFVLLPFAQTI